MSERLINVKGVTFWDGGNFQTIPEHIDLYAELCVLQDMIDCSKDVLESAVFIQDTSTARRAKYSIDSLEKALDNGLS